MRLPLQVPSCAAVGLLVALSGGCSAPPGLPAEQEAPAPAAVSFDEAALRTCPAGDEPWAAAIQEARAKGTLQRLGELTAEIQRICPDRWEPEWAYAETLYWDENRHDESCRLAYDRALRTAQAAGSAVGIARAAYRRAALHKANHEFEAATELYRSAMAEAQRANPPRADLVGYVENSLADLLVKSGRFVEASEMLARAIDNLTRVGETAAADLAQRNRGVLLEALGNLVESREVQEKFYGDALAQGNLENTSRAAVSLGNLARILGRWDEAREWFAKVSPQHEISLAAARLGLGRVALREGRLDEAAEHLHALARLTEDRSQRLYGELFLAEVELRRGRPLAAVERLEPILQGEAMKSIAWIGNRLLGRALATQPGRVDEALDHLRRAVAVIEEEGQGLDPAATLGFLHERAEVYADLAVMLATLDGAGHAAEILQIVERAHARALRRAVEEPGSEIGGVTDLATLQRGLREGEVLLDYLIGDDQGVVLAIGPGSVQIGLLPGWNELRKPVNQYRNALRRPLLQSAARADPLADLARYVEQGRALRRQLLGPVERIVGPARRIYIVPDQDLALLPFAALPLEDAGADGAPRFLGQLQETAVLPMAGVPAASDGRRAPFLFAGDPLPDPAGEFDRLRLAAEELSGVSSVWSDEAATLLTGADLQPEPFRRLDLASFRTLHFATHAVASSLDPRRCAVIFSGGSKLAMRDIAGLKLGPALVVLSACRTGEGEVVPGEGVVGLSWAFLRAGAREVAASLWSVEDESTSELMVSFHRFLREGHDPVAALSLAQRALQRRRPHPAYWAPFTLILGP